MVQICNKIQEVLESRGIEHLRPTDGQLEELDTTFYQWNRWVRKAANPSFEQIYSVAKMLGCSVDELFPDVDQAITPHKRHSLQKA